jgi:hypothetical protein
MPLTSDLGQRTAGIPDCHQTAPTRGRFAILTLCLLITSLAICSGLHLLKPNERANFWKIDLPGPLTYRYNIDTELYIWMALTFPDGLTTEIGRMRRSRPLHAALGWVAFQSLRPLETLIPRSLSERTDQFMGSSLTHPIWSDVPPAHFLRGWAGLILVSVLLHWLALVLIFRTLCEYFDPAPAALLTMIPVLHFNTVDYMIVPHTEPFNILLPALFLWGLRFWGRGRPGFPAAAAVGWAVLGKLMPYMALNWVWESLRARAPRGGARMLAIALLLLFGPVAGYLLILMILGITPHVHAAVHYRQVLWMGDFWREGRGLEIPVQLIRNLILHAVNTCRGFAIPLVAAAFLMLRSRRVDFALPALATSHLLIYTAACAAFWACVGFLPIRLSVTQYPGVMFFLGVQAVRKSRRPCRLLLAVLAVHIVCLILGGYRLN